MENVDALEVIANSEILLVPGRDAPTVLKVAVAGPHIDAEGRHGCICYIGPGDNRELSYMYLPRDDALHKVTQLLQKSGVTYINLTPDITLHLFQDGSKLPVEVRFREISFRDYLLAHVKANPR